MLELSFIQKISRKKRQRGYVNTSLFNVLKVYYFSVWTIKETVKNFKKENLSKKITQKTIKQKQENPFIFEEEKIKRQPNYSFFSLFNLVFILFFSFLFYGVNEYFSQLEKKSTPIVIPEKTLTQENIVKKNEVILEKKLLINPFTGTKDEFLEEEKPVLQLQEKSQIIQNSTFNDQKQAVNVIKNDKKQPVLVDKKVEKNITLTEKTDITPIIPEIPVKPYQPLPFNEITLTDKSKIKFYGTVSKEQ